MLEIAAQSGYIGKMERLEAIEHLKSIAAAAKNMGATTMYL